MSRTRSDGVVKLTYVAALADPTEATLDEANNGVHLHDLLRPDGLDIPQAGQTIDNADAGSSFDKTGRGTYGGSNGTVQLYRDAEVAGDLGWDTLPRGTTGYFIVGRFGGSDGTNADPAQNAYAVGDRIEIVPIDVTTRFMQPIARNQMQRCTVNFSIPDEIHDDAVIVANPV